MKVKSQAQALRGAHPLLRRLEVGASPMHDCCCHLAPTRWHGPIGEAQEARDKPGAEGWDRGDLLSRLKPCFRVPAVERIIARVWCKPIAN